MAKKKSKELPFITPIGQKEKVYAYLRKSSEDNKDGTKGNQPNSLEYQATEIARIAGKYNLEVVEYFQEDMSGMVAYIRPEFNKLLEKVENNREVTGIVVTEISRLGRNFGDGGRVLWLLQSGELQNIYTNDKQYSNSPSDQLMMALIFAIAKYESDENSYRSQQGTENKVRNHKMPAYRAPWGYKDVGKKGQKRWEVDITESHKVRRIFELYATGQYNIPALQKILASEGIVNPKTGWVFVQNTILKILNRKAYTGRFDFKGEVIEGAYEPIVSDLLFQQVQEVLKGKEHVKTKHMSHLYTGLIRCEICGAVLTATMAKKSIMYYRCSRPLTRVAEHKGMPYLEEKQVNKVIAKSLSNIEIDDELWNELKAYIESQENVEVSQIEREIGRVKMSLKAKKGERDGYMVSGGATGKSNDLDFKEKVHEYDDEIFQIQQRIEKLERDKLAVRENLLWKLSTLKSVGQRFISSSEFAQREIIKQFCANLTYDGRKLTIYWSPGIRVLSKGKEKSTWLLGKDSNLGPSA